MDNSESTLQDLIARCKKKDTYARRKLYEQYAPTMLGICIRYVNDKETAWDIMQEGFIKVFSKIDDYSGIGSFDGWLRKIFITSSLEHIRSMKASKLIFRLEDYETYEDTPAGIIEKLTEEEILECINTLPIGYRTVFNLYAIEGYSHAEIAQILRIKESSSRSQYARARQLLQAKIQMLYK